MIARARELYARHPAAADLTLIAMVTLAAAVLRLVLLGDLPYGVHPDEAQLGTDGRKILDGELWTPYTKAVLGQPSGHAYLTLPSFLVLGWTPLAMRLPLALVGLAAVPLLYLFVRQAYGRAEAFFAAAMVAVSYWHLMYSRVAHWSISYGTITLAVLLCVMLGINRRQRGWFVAGGGALGLGFYTYNIYPIAVAAMGVFLLALTWMRFRGAEWAWWRGSMLALGGVGLLVALPMLIYVANPDSFYWFHVRNYSEVGVWQTQEFKDEDLPGKVELVARQVETFAGAYAWDASEDIVDGNGIRPMFDPLTLVLLALGLVLAARDWRNPVALAALCCFFIIPLPAVLQQGSIMRQPVAAAPFAMFIAALPLAWLWRTAGRYWRDERAASLAIAGVACCMLAAITMITVRDYFWTWRKHEWPRFIYHAQITSAADYMDSLPEGTFVLYYSGRSPLDIEVIRFLAPDVEGSDRSIEWGPFEGSIEVHDRTRPVAFVLLEPYHELLPALEDTYPEGTARVIQRDGKFELAVYELPANVGTAGGEP